MSAEVKLTPREAEVFNRIEHGEKNKGIAVELGITESAVRQVRHRVTKKTKVNRPPEPLKDAVRALLDIKPYSNNGVWLGKKMRYRLEQALKHEEQQS